MKVLSRLGLVISAVTALTVAGAAQVAMAHHSTTADSTSTTASGRVRVVHLSPDAPPVDIVVNGAPTITNLAFKHASDYAALPEGTYDVAVTPAGANEVVVLSTTLSIRAGADATVVAAGTLDSIGLLVLSDDNAPPAPGNAKARFVHASPDAPAVDIAVRGGPVLFPNVAFGEFALYAEVPAGTYDLEVRVAGTDTVALNLPHVTFVDNHIVTIFATGLLADGSLSAVVVDYPSQSIAVQ